MLEVRDLSWSVQQKSIIENISFGVSEGSFTGIVGPNGSGKSTLLKNIYKALSGEGEVCLKGRRLKAISSRKLAREMAVVTQHGSSDFDFSVEEMVVMGRYPHKGLFRSYCASDRKLVDRALLSVGLETLKDRKFFTLSGGERQRVLIARALAQEADIIILDEPTNHLDVRYQLQVMELLRNLDITVIAAVHDMNIASLYCDKVVALKDGRVWNTGTPETVFTEDFFRDVFRLEAEIVRSRSTGRLSILYLGSHD